MGGVPGMGGMIQAPTLTVEQAGWKFASDSGDLAVTVFEDNFAVETASYSTWEGIDGFRSVLEQACRSVEHQLVPTVETRIGLRYVNQIVTPAVTEPTGWRGFIHDAFLGPVVDQVVGDGVQGMDSRVSIDLDGGMACALRYGSFLDASRPGHQTFLVDIDCFADGGVAFAADRIMATADDLNTSALGLFQSIITEELKEIFKAGHS
jgi:uncharacterized protein (TIGR04255 family)